MELRLTHVTLSVPAKPMVRSPDTDNSGRTALPTIGHKLSSAVQSLLPTWSNSTNANNANANKSNNSPSRPVLRDVSGVFRPGSMTLVLGQPGSGKSSLLKLLSGRLAANVTRTGDVSYAGLSESSLHGRVPQLVGCIPQHDVHFPTLTAYETIAFAQACGRPTTTTQHQQHDKHANDSLAETRLHELGLWHCRDTIVGDDMLRGVSGGERKRVTLGEMDVAGRRAVCFDEISTGLDSAATYDIVKQYRAAATTHGTVMVMALLQPAPEVVALFDTIILLNDGHMLYHGPPASAVAYFRERGLACPPQRDAADFLMDIGTQQQRQYEASATVSVPRDAREWAESFQRSALASQRLAELQVPPTEQPALVDVPAFYQPFMANVCRLVRRDLLVMVRNSAVLRARAVTIVISSLLHATLFYQIDPANVQLVMGILFATVLFLALEQSSQIPAFHASRSVFYKQRDAHLYPTSAYVAAASLAQVPVAVFQVVVFGSIVYWICGFTASASHFIVFELVLLLANLAFGSWFFLLAAATPNLHVSEPLNILSLLLFTLFAGFMIVRDLIPNYFIWFYWISPMAWCLRSVVINQYSADEFNACVYNGVDYCATHGVQSMGEYALSLFQMQSGRVWLWMGVVFLVGTYVLFMSLATIVLEHVRFDDHRDNPSPLVTNETGDLTDDHSTTDNNYQLTESPRAQVKVSVQDDGHDRRHFTPVTLAFKDLWYSVTVPGDSKAELVLLKGINGYAEPGTITALMGSSGAGKTTLLDVIAGRKTGGNIRGEIFLNGYAATDVAVRRCTAYCEQIDVHVEAATVREALTFSAFLRQSNEVPRSHKIDSVEECLDLLDLRPIADALVRGSSVEQLKRLTIGVELAAQPSALFLDEPTSGLDARAAKIIMDSVRKVADSGRTIVCTIHQPSFEVFQLFDKLLLLQRGGTTVYFGDLGHRGSAIVSYFEAIDGVVPIPSGDYNPATWMLEVIGAGVGKAAPQGEHEVKGPVMADFVALFHTSEKKTALDATLARDGLMRPAHGIPELSFSAKRAASETTQATMLLQRFFRTYWRTPDYMLTRALVYVMLALGFGLAFAGRDYDTYQGANAGIALVYATTVFIGVIAFEAAIPMASELRASFYRERAAQTYNALWYFVGSSVVEIPYVAVVTFLFCAVFFPLAGFVGVLRFVLYWFHLSLHVLLQTYIGELLAIVLPDLGAAMTVGVVVSAVFFNTMGFNPPASALPAGYKWLYEIVPTKFAFAIVGAILFGQCDDMETDLACRPLRGDLPPAFVAGTTIQQYVARVFLIQRDDIGYNFAMMLAYVAGVRVLTLLALRFVNHQHK